ncbi:glycosyltransferase [Actinomadura fibrosa]|uniref:Glycosyltransferase n=1 Tax=Actinomadura fibrosa TaxID=111802 RepID=A0ABW2X9W3_9ACTN|nr:glycosyltransferase [Actinomadura fibrosa]
MRFLFTPVGSQANVDAVTPLAMAVRSAGHEILLAANDPMMAYAEEVRIPAVSVMSEPTRHFVMTGRTRKDAQSPDDLREEARGMGRGFARMASASLDALLEVAEDWSPDLVVGGAMSFAAGLLAAHRKIPHVRFAEYPGIPVTDIDPAAEEGLRPELQRLGLSAPPAPALFIEACPPSLRPAPAPDVRPLRWVPSNPQRRLERWMYTRPEGRRRVLVTSGNHFRMLSPGALRHLADELAPLGAEVLVAAPGKTAEEFRAALEGLDGVRVGWMPLDVVAPTCDLVVNHTGGTTTMTVLAAGAPQLLFPPNTATKAVARAMTGFGSALTVLPERQETEEDKAAAFAAGCREILSTPSYAQRARELARENAALPSPVDTVRAMEALTET